MRRLLIVSPHFPPVNAPDLHRVRTALPYLRDHGWEPTVLAVDPAGVDRAQDPLLLSTVPAGVATIRVQPWPLRLTRLAGCGSLALRARGALRAAGDAQLAHQHFACVFFSTTEFPLTTLGLRWRQRCGVPFVVDWQDPWVSDYYARTGTRPPGGRLKYAFARHLARHGEPRVVRGAARIVAVSAGYVRQLAARHVGWDSRQATVLPFGAPERDFELLTEWGVPPPDLGLPAGVETWVYAGRGGPDLHRAARALFEAVRAERATAPDRWGHRRLVFLGTSYVPSARAAPSLAPLATECGVGDLVLEQPVRAPYFATLALLRSATRLLVLGSDDPDYTASKVYPYLLARRPLLAILHEGSDAADFLRRVGGGEVVTFSPATPTADTAAALRATAWWRSNAPPVPALDPAVFAGCTARAMTARLAGVFAAAADGTRRSDQTGAG